MMLEFDDEWKKRQYIKHCIPNRTRKCFDQGFPKEQCKNCSYEKDCKLLDDNKEFYRKYFKGKR